MSAQNKVTVIMIKLDSGDYIPKAFVDNFRQAGEHLVSQGYKYAGPTVYTKTENGHTYSATYWNVGREASL